MHTVTAHTVNVHTSRWAISRYYAEARSLTLKPFYSIIFKRNETKQEIWLSDIGTVGPSVERVFKSIMTVKY